MADSKNQLFKLLDNVTDCSRKQLVILSILGFILLIVGMILPIVALIKTRPVLDALDDPTKIDNEKIKDGANWFWYLWIGGAICLVLMLIFSVLFLSRLFVPRSGEEAFGRRAMGSKKNMAFVGLMVFIFCALSATLIWSLIKSQDGILDIVKAAQTNQDVGIGKKNKEALWTLWLMIIIILPLSTNFISYASGK